MKTNEAGVALIKNAEGLRLDAYQDMAGVWTVGYGHTGDVKAGDHITAHQADVILRMDLEKFETGINTLALDLNENEFSALVSFAFNLGLGALERSYLLTRLRCGEKDKAALEFMKWVNAAHHVQPGLVKRRAAEKALFLTPVADQG